MSTVVLDQNRGFLTTVGFQATSGFDLGCRRVDFAARPPKAPAAPSTTVKEPADTTSSADNSHVGWKGLLEISRNSGASGVLGAKATVEEAQGSPDSKIEICCTAHTSPAIRRLVKSVIRGLKACQEPETTEGGMGGTYFFMNENGRKVAIMKPCDEEPLAPNNPKGYVGRSLGDPGFKPTVRVGEAAMREVAAYLLDYDNFANVPTSVLVRARHPVFCYNNKMNSVRQSSLDLGALPPAALAAANASVTSDVLEMGPCTAGQLPMKLGSLQEFVHHQCDTSEMGPSRFSAKDVHRIGIFDIRLFNTDRHAGNMLVRVSKDSRKDIRTMGVEQSYELIPIDHGFCLPETLEAPYFEWLHWPQTLLPFSEEEVDYVRNLDVEADVQLLQKELPNLRPECLRLLEVSTTLLKKCVEAGLNLHEIGQVVSRPFGDTDEEPSELEKICMSARQAVDAAQELPEEQSECDESSECFSIEEEDEEDVAADELMPSKSKELGASDEMLFDLDEEAAGHNVYMKGHSMNSSPGQISPGSSLSSGDHLSFDRSDTNESSKAPARETKMARSVHVTQGRWNLLKGRAHAMRRHRKPANKRTSPQAYPPPVMASAPDQLNGQGLFSNLNDAQWAYFMEVVRAEVDRALTEGKWKQQGGRDTGAIAMSCPRF